MASDSVESIDDSSDKLGAFDRLVEDISLYLRDTKLDVKERLRIERAISKFGSQASPDWLVNLLVSVYNKVQGA